VALKLVRPVSSALPSTPVRNESSEAYHFSHLTLDGVARMTPSQQQSQSNPIFGRHSFPDPPIDVAATGDMDWEPTPSKGFLASRGEDDDTFDTQNQAQRMNWDSFGVGLQRIFPKAEQASTGLETLFGTRDLLNDPIERMDGVEQHPQSAFAPRMTGHPGNSIALQTGQGPTSASQQSGSSSALVLDADLVRKAMVGFTVIRLFGAAIASVVYLTNEALYDLVFSRSSRTITNLELGANVLDVVIGLNGGSKTTNARMILICLFLVVRGATRTVSAHGLVALGWNWTIEYPRWIAVGEWTLWGLVDFVCAVAM
jgi:hypothetical protein